MIVLPGGHYPRSIAVSRRAILAAARVAGPKHKIDELRVLEGTSAELPSLGVWENDIDENTWLAASPSGGSIIAAQANGTALLYDANVDSFVSAVQAADKLSGTVAALSDETFVVDNLVMNQLAYKQTLSTAGGLSSGFALVDGLGVRSTAPDSASPGVIERVNFESGVTIRPTRMSEAPLVSPSDNSVFLRALAALPDRSAIVSLSTSGFTVLPWVYDAALAKPQIQSIASAADDLAGRYRRPLLQSGAHT